MTDMMDFIQDTVNGKNQYKQKREALRDYIYTYHNTDNFKD